MSLPNRVAKGVPTGGQFAAGAKTESGVSLGAAARTPANAPAYTQPSAPSTPAQGKFWNALGSLTFGRGEGGRMDRFDKTNAVAAAGVAAGATAMIGGAFAAAPVMAGAAGAVMVVSAVSVMVATAAQYSKRFGKTA